ncbi:MAG TPA: sortase [Acidimicrobiales bacterium]|nr:sortase [Acidimicrobiales bacterium]
MAPRQPPKRRGRLIAKVAVAGLAAAGAATISYAFSDQAHAPVPKPSAAGRIAPGVPGPSGRRTQAPAAPDSLRGGSAGPGPASLPSAVSVPAIGVNSTLEQLGLNPERSVAVPSSFQQAGWYDHSAQCGQPGPSVILGHVDSYRGPGVFFRLGALAPGDAVILRCADGGTEIFTITGVRQYSKDAFPTLAVYGPTVTPTIRLITCGGAFDHASGHYLSNVIAFGELESRT